MANQRAGVAYWGALLAIALLGACSADDAPSTDDAGCTDGDGCDDDPVDDSGDGDIPMQKLGCDGDGFPEFSGGIDISSQAELDLLAGCRSFPAYAEIGGGDIVNLTPLANLENVGGFFGLATLDNLIGLDNLRTVTDRLILNRLDAKDLEPLSSLMRIEARDLDEPGWSGSIDIWRNDRLESLEGLRNVAGIRSLYVGFNPLLRSLSGPRVEAEAENLTARGQALEDLAAFSMVQSAWSLTIETPALTHLDDLVRLRTLTGGLRLETPSLESLTGVAELGTIGSLSLEALGPVDATPLGNATISRDLVLRNLDNTTLRFPRVTTLEGGLLIDSVIGFEEQSLPALRSVARLAVINNSTMTSIALPELASVEENLVIAGNPALEHDEAVAFAASLDVDGSVKIYNNLNSPPPLDPCPFAGDGSCDEPDLCAEGTEPVDCGPGDE